MSLNVYLTVEDYTKTEAKIFIREDGQTKEISLDEWNGRFPDREPVYVEGGESNTVFSANITHNLGEMAGYAGNLYKLLWRPEELFINRANELILPLEKSLQLLKSDPEYFKKYNPENGWGTYEGLVIFVENYLRACKEYPDADIHVSR